MYTLICSLILLQTLWNISAFFIDSVLLCFNEPGPTGEIVAEADDKEEAVLIAEFDLDVIKFKRKSWGVFRDRRPDLYKVLLTLDGSNPAVWCILRLSSGQAHYRNCCSIAILVISSFCVRFDFWR